MLAVKTPSLYRTKFFRFLTTNDMPMQPTIETARYILRPMIATDAAGIFELDSNPNVHLYLGNQPIKTMAEAEATVKYVQNQYVKHGIGRWAVVDKKTQEFVGWSGLKYEEYVRTDMNYYDLGYRLREKFWGKGIATETAKASLAYGFQTMNLEEIFAGAHVENAGSNAVLQKVGLEHLETFIFDGEPHHWYRIRKRDWVSKNAI